MATEKNKALQISVLDCTLRDGGYYNNWDFEDGLVERYVKGIVESGVQYIELGFRSPDRKGFAGRFKYCSDDLINRLVPDHAPAIAVMIDGRDFIIEGGEIDEKSLNEYFSPSDRSRVDLVRVTATQSTTAEVVRISEILKSLGYAVSVNLMRASLLSDRDLVDSAKALEKSSVDVMYLADSFGGLEPRRVAEAFGILRENFSRRLGFHAHDNTGLALANSIAAIETGATIIDSSISGMGRGAGNLSTEQFLPYLRFQRQMKVFDIAPLVGVVSSDFRGLQDRYQWGSSLPYILSGVYNLHPMYAQNLLKGVRYSPADVIQTLETLHRNGSGGSFSPDLLTQAIRDRYAAVTSPVQVPTLSGYRAGLPVFESSGASRPVLMVASGPSVSRHQSAVNEFIRKHDPIVVECNVHGGIEVGKDHISVFTNSRRLRQFLPVIAGSRVRVLLGVPVVDEDVAEGLNKKDVYGYSCEVREGQFESKGDGCVIPHDVVTMAALAFCLQMSPSRIFLCGIDGYAAGTTEVNSLSGSEKIVLDQEMHDFFKLLKERSAASETQLTSLTPTGFDLPKESIYAYL